MSLSLDREAQLTPMASLAHFRALPIELRAQIEAQLDMTRVRSTVHRSGWRAFTPTTAARALMCKETVMEFRERMYDRCHPDTGIYNEACIVAAMFQFLQATST